MRKNGFLITLFEHLGEPCIKLEHALAFPVIRAIAFHFMFMWFELSFMLSLLDFLVRSPLFVPFLLSTVHPVSREFFNVSIRRHVFVY